MKQEKEKSTELLQVITVGETTFPVEVRDGRLAVNLTAMAKLYGKLPNDWLKTKEAQHYLQAVSVTKKIKATDLVEIRRGGIPQMQGTWVYDRCIAVRFAQWLDEYLAIVVDALLIDLMEGRKFIAETTQFENRQFVSLEDFCKTYRLSPNVFYSYKAHYPYEYIWTGGSWHMNKRLCRYIALKNQLNQNKHAMYQCKIDVGNQQRESDFKEWN